MSAAVYGGDLNQTDIFAVDQAGTGLVTVTAHTMVPTTTAITDNEDAFFQVLQNLQGNYNLTGAGNKQMEITFDQNRFSGDLMRAAKVFAVPARGTDEYYTNGVKSPAVQGTDTIYPLLSISYIGADPDQSGKTLVLVVHGGFKEGTSSFSTKNGEARKPKIDISSAPTKAALVIPSEAFDPAKVTVVSDVTIASGDEYAVLSLTTAS